MLESPRLLVEVENVGMVGVVVYVEVDAIRLSIDTVSTATFLLFAL